MFHVFNNLEEKVNLPLQFTFPFFYKPHSLSILAANQLRSYLLTKSEWETELAMGKMFGVLVVKDESNRLGFLAAFSGQLNGSYLHDYFVPPIYDLNDSSSFFRSEEKKISEINKVLDDDDFLQKKSSLESQYQERLALYEQLKAEKKRSLQQAKEERDKKRLAGVSESESLELIKKSQYEKAEARRCIKEFEKYLNEARDALYAFQSYETSLRTERKERSIALQKRLFEQFQFLNARGEWTTLLDIFSPDLPPSGAGECAAPKLLQYAYSHHYQPLCMAEFWWGKSPDMLIRRHGKFYPSCTAKCKPILDFMLQGLDVEPSPLSSACYSMKDISIVYEDEWLLIVNKPHGLLSAPGLSSTLSVQSILQEHYRQTTLKVTHRLDMSTSGLLVVAKNEDVFCRMQEMFSKREVKKRYLALLDGVVERKKGRIELPISPSWENRPYQVVNHENGKEAVTEYELIEVKDERSKVWFYPLTGRTHQLRLHAAHKEGLNCPIVGDDLYGDPAEHLYLQAQRIEFEHPITHVCLKVEVPCEF